MGKIISRFEEKGFKIIAMDFGTFSIDQAEKHYAEHKGKPHFERITNSLSSGNLAVLLLEGENVIKSTRLMIGSTNPGEALPGTIRGDFCTSIKSNAIHASDSRESFIRESILWFPEIIFSFE